MDEEQRKKYAALALMTAIEKEKSDSRIAKNRRSRRWWTRSWIARRNEGLGVLNMLHSELRAEDPNSFANYTRMDQDIFDVLLKLVEADITKLDTVMREAIKPRDRLAITLRFLAVGKTYMDLHYSTRIAPNTLLIIIPEVLEAILNNIEDDSVKVPRTTRGWEELSAQFEALWQFPHCIGAIDGKHINFRAARVEGSLYRNYKGRDSIVLLAVVDANYKFIYTDIGKNGRVNDGAIFAQGSLNAAIQSGTLSLPASCRIPGFHGNSDTEPPFKFPYVFVADDAFSLKENIMKPYKKRGLTNDEKIFNYRLSRSRRIVENAFGMMANKFGILLGTICLPVQKVELIVRTIVALHNFILNRKPKWYMPPELQGCTGQNDIELPRMDSLGQQRGNHPRHAATEVQDKFKEYFNSVGQVTWQNECITQGNY